MAVRLVERQKSDVLPVAEDILATDHPFRITKEPSYARSQWSTLLGIVHHHLLGMNSLAAQCLLQFLEVRKQHGGIVGTLDTKYLAKLVSRSLAASNCVAGNDTSLADVIFA